MTVRGRIVSMSHLGGLLVDFEGVPPGLGWTVQIEGGQNIGRVDSVIGSVNSGLIHVVLSKRIDPASATGAPVEIFRSSNKKSQFGNRGKGGSRNRISKVARKAGHRKNGTTNRVLPTWVCGKCRTLNSRTGRCTNCNERRSETKKPNQNRGSDRGSKGRQSGYKKDGKRSNPRHNRRSPGGKKTQTSPYNQPDRGKKRTRRKPQR